MRIFFVLFVAVMSFATGVWYTCGFEPTTALPISVTPTNTAQETPVTSAAPQATYTNADVNMIQITAPAPGATISSSFTISGRARGGWYFEASFPYQVFDANEKKIAEGPVQAAGDWMTPEFVPFSLQITVPNYKGKAQLVLKNDNPSGLPENDASISIPITIQ